MRGSNTPTMLLSRDFLYTLSHCPLYRSSTLLHLICCGRSPLFPHSCLRWEPLLLILPPWSSSFIGSELNLPTSTEPPSAVWFSLIFVPVTLSPHFPNWIRDLCGNTKTYHESYFKFSSPYPIDSIWNNLKWWDPSSPKRSFQHRSGGVKDKIERRLLSV